MPILLSSTAISNLRNMEIAAKFDSRQQPPSGYGIPDKEIRRLRARLILEEALETINALGFSVTVDEGDNCCISDEEPFDPILEEIIDGAADVIYVAVGLLCACGAPDLPHLDEVNRANDDKFPGGIATINPETGKYLKPPGWKGPDHEAVMMGVKRLT